MPMHWLACVAAALALAAQPTPSPSPSASPSPTPNPNAYDIEVFGSTHKAKVGDLVEVTFGARNLGPGIAPGSGGAGDNKHRLLATLPPGTELVHSPCFPPQPPSAACDIFGRLEAGQSATFTLTVRVNEARHNATGSVSRHYRAGLFNPQPDLDTNPANNTAGIVIDSGQSLPQTGPNVTVLVTTGLGAITVGSLILFALRRHRIGRRATLQ